MHRAINYDERDPFLCNSCGYSKYAKFETTVSGKSCAAVDPIESEEDRKKVCTYVLGSKISLCQTCNMQFANTLHKTCSDKVTSLLLLQLLYP